MELSLSLGRPNRRDRFGAGELHRTYCFAALARTQASQSAEREKTTIKKELINRLARRGPLSRASEFAKHGAGGRKVCAILERLTRRRAGQRCSLNTPL